MDLSDLIARNAAFTPAKPAILFEGESLSYAAFAARIERTADHGFGPRYLGYENNR